MPDSTSSEPWVSICAFHRMLTHRRLPARLAGVFFRRFGRLLSSGLAGPLGAIHRLHHQYYRRGVRIPHSPLVNFFWGHVGWLLVDNRQLRQMSTYGVMRRDLLRRPVLHAIGARRHLGMGQPGAMVGVPGRRKSSSLISATPRKCAARRREPAWSVPPSKMVNQLGILGFRGMAGRVGRFEHLAQFVRALSRCRVRTSLPLRRIASGAL